MTPRDKAMTVVSLSGLMAMVFVMLAAQLGFAYWWPTFWIVGIATIVGTLWIEERSLAKAFAIVTLLGVGLLGWAVPLTEPNVGAPQGFSIAPFFWAAGVTVWRIVPFGIVLVIATPRRRRR